MVNKRDAIGGGLLSELPRLRDYVSGRISSWDRTGGNKDFITVPRDSTERIAEVEGSGCVKHIWCTIACKDPNYLRKILFKMFWDGEKQPSVEVPIGDFFGVGHSLTTNFVSLPLAMSPQDGKGFNCYFPMPFSSGARIEVANECDTDIQSLYFYVDYEKYDELPPDMGRFHAMWNRQNPCDGISDSGMSNQEFQLVGSNPTGDGNYVILEAEGKGHYVGCILNVCNLRKTEAHNWYGEGDDMIFVDGEKWPPSLHGTGTEDYFNMAWCPTQRYCSPYHGLILPGGDNWSGEITIYRFHIEDPIYFKKSIRVTIEHGHANRRSDDYSSTAYWYQAEPHKAFPPMLPAAQRLPRRS